MKIFRGIVSLVLGFLAIPALMRLSLIIVLSLWPGLLQPAGWPDASIPGPPGPPTATFMLLNLGLVAAASAIAAVVTALVAPEPPYLWVLLLAFLVFVGGLVVGVRNYGGVTPGWYLLGLPLANGIGVAAGGWAFLRWRERRT